jgi:hypothetical protein
MVYGDRLRRERGEREGVRVAGAGLEKDMITPTRSLLSNYDSSLSLSVIRG